MTLNCHIPTKSDGVKIPVARTLPTIETYPESSTESYTAAEMTVELEYYNLTKGHDYSIEWGFCDPDWYEIERLPYADDSGLQMKGKELFTPTNSDGTTSWTVQFDANGMERKECAVLISLFDIDEQAYVFRPLNYYSESYDLVTIPELHSSIR